MHDSQELLTYIDDGVAQLIKRGRFENGRPFRETQRQALDAYTKFLARKDLTADERLKGFFEIPTGVGKTALFLGIIASAEKLARKNGQKLDIVILVPTLTLLKQTVDNIGQYAPGLVKKIGLYGDKYKQLGRQLTVMTYDAFTKLVEAKKLSSKNVDILISDEAHRGTSDRRSLNLFRAFKGATVMLAVTATSRFDLEKSVEQTHHNRIFAKTLPEAMSDGELAAYIHSQLYIVRVQPTPEQKKRLVQAREGDGYRYAMRKAAWNQRVLHQFRDGRDHQTGDLLSDNITAFFVGDTKQANDLEKNLNADPILQARAKKGKFQGVVITIHTRMNPAEQRRRMEDFLAGKYMAVVGDSKFKEGFDYAPLKTIFDFPRGSLVDKAQIMGRGARKWWNEKKKREEGMTFMDYVVYVGSDDPEEDKKFLNQAKRNAVYAWDVLENTAIFAPGKKPRKVAVSSKTGGVSGDVPGQTVEAFETLERVNLLRAQVARLRREDWIDVTDSMNRFLDRQKLRTGVSAKALLNSIKDCPEDLTERVIEHLLNKNVQTVNKHHWEIIKPAYENLPNGQKYIPYDAKKKKWLKAQKARIGISDTQLFERIKNKPEGMHKNSIHDFAIRKTIRDDFWQAIEQVCAELTVSEYIPYTPKMKKWLKEQSVKTKLGSFAILRVMEVVPKGLLPSVSHNILTGRNNIVRKVFWDALETAYKDYQADKTKVIEFKEAKRKWLEKQKNRMGLSNAQVFHKIKNPPQDLTPNIVQTLFRTKNPIKTIYRVHWEAIESAFTTAAKIATGSKRAHHRNPVSRKTGNLVID